MTGVSAMESAVIMVERQHGVGIPGFSASSRVCTSTFTR